MITGGRRTILGVALGSYLLSLGFLAGIVTEWDLFDQRTGVLTRYDKAVRQSRADLLRPAQGVPEVREASQAPWTVHIRQVQEALAEKNLVAAVRAWHDAYTAALESRRWEGMVEIGDVYLQIGETAGFRKPWEARAREIYLTALLRARQQRSIAGVLRAAEAFTALGDREVVEQCIHIAEALAARGRDTKALNRVRAFRERSAGQLLAVKSLNVDPF